MSPIWLKFIKSILLAAVLGFCAKGFGQVKQQQKDSTDSVYEKIEDYSKKNKVTRFLHNLIFRSGNSSKDRAAGFYVNYGPYEGKIIRNINIETHDPFGFSLRDSTQRANSWLEKTGNNLHIKSKKFNIGNLLLIKENEPLDSLLISETERLIRSKNYIRSVKISPKAVDNTVDSVDIYIEVLDSWSLIGEVSFSTSKTKVKINERNFLGFGHQFKPDITYRYADQKFAHDILYNVENIKHTYIGASARYYRGLDGFYNRRLNIERPFYSAFSTWAGGIYLDQRYWQENFSNDPQDLQLQDFNYQSQDVWGGYSFKIFKGKLLEDRTSSLIAALRFLNVDYKQRPSLEYDSIRFFSDEMFVLGSIGITSQQYVKDSYIFRDGIIEDVPVGNSYALLAGVQQKNDKNRPYLGASVSRGKYFNWGHLSANLAFGTFLNNSRLQQTTFSFQANYFTNLLNLNGGWKMRQFVKPKFVIGTNRLNSMGDRLTIDETDRFQRFYYNADRGDTNHGIPGFESNKRGTKKYVLSLQSQFYAPWELWGFRINPFLNINAAMLGNEGTSITKSRFYSSLGVGVLIRNDYIVFNAFQLSLAYYPNMPGEGNHIFRTNAFRTQDFGFQHFNLGKPKPVPYR